MNRRKLLAVGVSLIVAGSLAPSALAHEEAPKPKPAYSAPMAKPAPKPAAPGWEGMPGDHHAAGDDHHAAEAAHAAKPAKRDTGSVEGGFGSSGNSGGPISGSDAAPSHGHGDNAGGNIH